MESTKNEAIGVLVAPATANSENAIAIFSSDESTDKICATLIAKLALRGYATHALADGGFIVCRWNLSRSCPDLRSLSAFARMVGAA